MSQTKDKGPSRPGQRFKVTVYSSLGGSWQKWRGGAKGETWCTVHVWGERDRNIQVFWVFFALAQLIEPDKLSNVPAWVKSHSFAFWIIAWVSSNTKKTHSWYMQTYLDSAWTNILYTQQWCHDEWLPMYDASEPPLLKRNNNKVIQILKLSIIRSIIRRNKFN